MMVVLNRKDNNSSHFAWTFMYSHPSLVTYIQTRARVASARLSAHRLTVLGRRLLDCSTQRHLQREIHDAHALMDAARR